MRRSRSVGRGAGEIEGESGKRSASRATGPLARSLAHAPGKETCSVIPSVAWKWGLLECVRRTDTTTKRRRTRARARAQEKLVPGRLSCLLSFCKCGICFPALPAMPPTVLAARRISCISGERLQVESGVGEGRGGTGRREGERA